MYIYLYVYYTPNKTAIFTVIFKSLQKKVPQWRHKNI